MNLTRLSLLLLVPLTLVAACTQEPTKRLPRSLEIGPLSLQEVEERFLSSPPETLSLEAQRAWQRFILLGWREMTRLQQAGTALQFIDKQFADIQDVQQYLQDTLGREAEKTALAYWLVREIYPNEEILFTAGLAAPGSGDELQALSYRLDQAGGIPIFSLEAKELIPVVSIGWMRGADPLQRVFVIRANEGLAQANPSLRFA